MSINGINGNLTKFLGNLKLNAGKDSLNGLMDPAELATPRSLAANTDPSNLMARNYADPNPEKSKYILAKLNSFETEKTLKNKMDSIVSLLKTEIGDDRSSAAAGLNALKAKKLISQVKRDEVVEESEDHLKSSRDDLEKAAEEAVASNEVDFTPLPTGSNADSGSAPTPEAEAAPTPDAAAVSVDITV